MQCCPSNIVINLIVLIIDQLDVFLCKIFPLDYVCLYFILIVIILAYLDEEVYLVKTLFLHLRLIL